MRAMKMLMYMLVHMTITRAVTATASKTNARKIPEHWNLLAKSEFVYSTVLMLLLVVDQASKQYGCARCGTSTLRYRWALTFAGICHEPFREIIMKLQKCCFAGARPTRLAQLVQYRDEGVWTWHVACSASSRGRSEEGIRCIRCIRCLRWA